MQKASINHQQIIFFCTQTNCWLSVKLILQQRGHCHARQRGLSRNEQTERQMTLFMLAVNRSQCRRTESSSPAELWLCATKTKQYSYVQIKGHFFTLAANGDICPDLIGVEFSARVWRSDSRGKTMGPTAARVQGWTCQLAMCTTLWQCELFKLFEDRGFQDTQHSASHTNCTCIQQD